MQGKTHIAAGVCVGISLYSVLHPTNCGELAVTISAAIGALMPDIDHTRSTISNTNILTKITSKIIRFTVGQRSLFHSPFFAVIILIGMMSLLLGSGYETKAPIIIAFFMGYISHIFLDMLTKDGIPLIYPFKKNHFSIGKCHSNGLVNWLLFGAFSFLDVMLCFI